MTRIAMAVLAAITLAGSPAALAEVKPTASRPLPSSYAPGPHTGPHVYGSPIEPRIVGHAQPPRHQRAPPAAHSKAGVTRAAHAQAAKSQRSAPVPAPAPTPP